MAHYVCTGGCGEVSDYPGTCDAKNCIKYHLPLTLCHCEDGMHREALENPNISASEQVTHET
jgi:hypothetical protein